MLWTRITIGMLASIQVFIYTMMIVEAFSDRTADFRLLATILATVSVIAGLQLLDAHLR